MKIVNLVENTEGAPGCGATHGLSFYVETPNHRALVDAGPSDLIVKNAAALGVDLSGVDTAVVSHGHYDHSDGLPAFSKINTHAKIYFRKGAEADYCSVSGGPLHYIGMDPAAKVLPNSVWLTEDTRIDDELFIFGGISGRRAWPEGNRALLKRTSEGVMQDAFDHEQCLVVTEGARRVLLSGCAHNGILNILDRFHELLGSWPDAVFSGFHMMQPDALSARQVAIVEDTARALAKLPTAFYTCHCTGLPAYGIMKGIMGERLHYAHTGDRFEL